MKRSTLIALVTATVVKRRRDRDAGGPGSPGHACAVKSNSTTHLAWPTLHVRARRGGLLQLRFMSEPSIGEHLTASGAVK
jgi:hypothetical protein